MEDARQRVDGGTLADAVLLFAEALEPALQVARQGEADQQRQQCADQATDGDVEAAGVDDAVIEDRLQVGPAA